MYPTLGGIPRLVVLSPGDQRGRQFDLSREHLLVGRGDQCDLHFDDPFVSRTHAQFERHGQAYYVRDMGSSSGTFVNGVATAEARELRHGDLIRFADVEVRFVVAGEQQAYPSSPPAQAYPSFPPAQAYPPGSPAGPAAPPPGSPVSFGIGQQRDGVFHNVGRDQYVMQQRESFLGHVAATRTKARWLIWLGFGLTVVGTAMFASGVFGFITSITDAMKNDTEPEIVSPFGGDVGGFPAGIIGWALAAAGSFLIVLGIVLHVVAASRRKRVDRDFPLPFHH